MIRPKPIYSYLAAALLATITIVTFAVFQNFGPQSVIRRFHMDVARGDWRDISQVSLEPWSAPATKTLYIDVQRLVQINASYEIVGLKRGLRPNEVLATVDYRLPNGMESPFEWHVVQTRTDWRVDCAATLKAPIG